MFVPVKESRKNATSGTVFLQFNYFRQKYLAVMAATADEGRQVPLTKSCKMQKNYTGQRVQKGAKGCKRLNILSNILYSIAMAAMVDEGREEGVIRSGSITGCIIGWRHWRCSANDQKSIYKNPQFFLEIHLKRNLHLGDFPNEFLFSGSTDCLPDFVVGFK